MIKEALLFVGGAACGFAAAVLILRDRYKTMVDEEVQSVINWANSKSVDGAKEKEDRTKKREQMKKLAAEYKSVAEEEPYPDGYVEPYTISDSDFEEANGYDKISLDYYLQGESLYDGEVRVEDVEDTVGSDNLVRLHGDLNTVYVRNENSKIDYEIVGIDGRFGVY